MIKIVFLILLFIFISVLLFLIAVFLHEIGHGIFGLFCGYEFTLIQFGPFVWRKKDGKMRFSMHGSKKRYGGSVLIKIKNTEYLSKKGMFVSMLGGPLTSLFLSLASFTVAHVFRPVFPINRSFLYTLHFVIPFIFGVASLLVFIATSIPLKRRVFNLYTDGTTIWGLYRNTPLGNIIYNIWFIYQCFANDAEADHAEEIADKICYILKNHEVADDLDIIAILSYMLVKGISVMDLDQEAIQKQINEVIAHAKPKKRALLKRLVYAMQASEA